MKNVNLHWTTVVTEKLMLGFIGILTTVAAGMDVYDMFLARRIELADLFLLFIYTEIVGMVGAYFANNRIPVSLPIIIAITALCRLIVLHSKDADPWVLIAEAGAILILAGAAYLMSYKEWLSLEKEKIRNED
mgnify:FL=1|tara:strand:+ start:359 stop:757 length:399 start_codon:yes stop_codon:yes gene_type:complete